MVTAAVAPELRTPTAPRQRLLGYFLLGLVFGVVLTKSEVVSWFRIQEMFRLHSFHMYGVIGTAIAVAAISVALIRRLKVRALTGEEIAIAPKAFGTGRRYWIGGTVFGLGWALTGACPGPLVALIGSGATVFVVAVLAAVAGTWLYGVLRPHLLGTAGLALAEVALEVGVQTQPQVAKPLLEDGRQLHGRRRAAVGGSRGFEFDAEAHLDRQLPLERRMHSRAQAPTRVFGAHARSVRGQQVRRGFPVRHDPVRQLEREVRLVLARRHRPVACGRAARRMVQVSLQLPLTGRGGSGGGGHQLPRRPPPRTRGRPRPGS